MTFDKWFNKQSKLIQIILLLIPGVNWITELLVRVSRFLRTKDGDYVLNAAGAMNMDANPANYVRVTNLTATAVDEMGYIYQNDFANYEYHDF